jgi:hypothetical protein
MRSLYPLDDTEALKCELATQVLCSYGKLRFKANGWSMFPAVRPGDMLVVERVDSFVIAEGDVVLFGRDSRLFAHRVIAKSALGNSGILTRGDAMPQADSPVREHELLGRVKYVIRNGKCLEPNRSLSLGEQVISALVRHSEVTARIVVGVHGMRQTSQVQV